MSEKEKNSLHWTETSCVFFSQRRHVVCSFTTHNLVLIKEIIIFFAFSYHLLLKVKVSIISIKPFIMQSAMIYDPYYERIMKVSMTSILVSICICGLIGN